MATYTTNYNLEKPDASDPFGDFRQSYNDNMDIIDANLGGGGGGGGHTIVDENGSDMPAESKLQFTGNVSVTDDNVNGATVVDIKGGNVYGAFLDPSRVIYSAFTFDNTEHSWTATEDVILTDDILPPSGSMAWYVRIDGKQVGAGYDLGNLFVYVKKGQVVTYRAKSGSVMKAYGLTQGTNGIYAPVIYSDTERVIGVWRDNKPLYAKTVSFTTGNTSGYLNYLTDIENPETMMINFGGSFYITGTAKVPAMAYFGTLNASADTNAFAVLCNVDNGYLRLDYRVGTSAYSKTAYVTVLYTKTTDVAGSGDYNTYGVPTVHYSTSEQVIGTWVNNKPVYQKTFVFTPNALTTSIDVSGLQIEDLIERKGTFTRNAGSQIQQKAVDYRTEAPSSNNYGIQCEIRDTNLQVSINGYTYTEITQFRITIKYTKTTD